MSETTENAGDSAAAVEAPAAETAEAAPAAEAANEETTAATAETTEATENGNGSTTSDETSGLERKIIQQLEYYFGDANLARDKFMLEQIGKDDGWVPLDVLLTFKRLAGLSTDVEFIVNSIAKSDEGLIEISEDRQKLRRHPERPVPEQNEERRKEIMSRTAYVKGFPLDTDMSALLDFFAPYEKVVNITMRKYLDKAQKCYKFKGSVFVTFEKREQTEEFIGKPKVSFGERDLLRKWQEKYVEEKRAEVQEKLKSKDKKKQKQREEEVKFELPKGTVLLFENATDGLTRELLREVIDKMPGEWEVAYLDYSKGEKQGHIRFVAENIAAKFLEKLEDNKLKINDDIELTLRLLTDEEEQKFLAEAVVQMKNRRQNQGKNKYGNRKRRGGGSGGDYKRRRND